MASTARKSRVANKDDVQKRFDAALARFLARAREDRYVLAVIVAGSMSNDRVWEKSDLDLIVITEERGSASHAGSAAGRIVRAHTDRDETFLTLLEEEVTIHAILTTRAKFRQLVEGSLQSSFMHSLIAKSKLAFTRDETIGELYEGIGHLGTRDQQVQLLNAAVEVIPSLYKAQKWYHVRGDCEYAFLWIMFCLQGLARVEVHLDGQIAGREVIQQAMEINPKLFGRLYTGLVNAKKTPEVISAALDEIEAYLARKSRVLFGPVFDYLDEAGAPRSATDVAFWFEQHFGTRLAVAACEWLADRNMITRLTLPVHLTEKSKVAFEEMAFFYQADQGADRPKG